MPRSQNGYPANDPSLIRGYDIPGTRSFVRLRKGACGALLVHLAAWIDTNVESLDLQGAEDEWGYAPREIRGGTSLSNHASGTAIDINSTRHPLGVRGTWTAAQRRKVNAKLAQLDGVVRWGENYLLRKDGMHFEIVKDEAVVRAVVRKLNIDADGVRHFVLTRTLAAGSRGNDVRRVQKLVGVKVDGVYGPDTVAAVKRWQARHHLTADGVFGPRSAAAAGWTFR